MQKLLFPLIIIILIFAASYLGFKKLIGQNLNGNKPNLIQSGLQSKKPVNILLLGYGGGNHDGAYLTDSMLIVQIDPSSKNIILISVPRDLWINIPTNLSGGSYWKINAAYTIGMDDTDYPNKPSQFKGKNGAGNLAKAMVEKVTGLTIDRFVAADFSSFSQAIDSLGGVDVNNEQTFDDYAYPIDGKENDLCGKTPDSLTADEKQTPLDNLPTVFPCRFEHIHFNQGLIHLNGTDALKFVRSRHSDIAGTDFGRSMRQRDLLSSLKKKMLSLSILPKLLPLYQSLNGHTFTDLSFSEINSLLANAKDFEAYGIKSVGLTDQNVLDYTFTDDGQYILEPKAGKDNWNSINAYLLTELNKITHIDLPVVNIVNTTGKAGLAEYALNRLKNKNITATVGTDSSIKEETKTAITVYDQELDQQKVNEIETEFNTKATIATAKEPNLQYNVLVVIGDDYKDANQNAIN